jgi:hypothetical protein
MVENENPNGGRKIAALSRSINGVTPRGGTSTMLFEDKNLLISVRKQSAQARRRRAVGRSSAACRSGVADNKQKKAAGKERKNRRP